MLQWSIRPSFPKITGLTLWDLWDLSFKLFLKKIYFLFFSSLDPPSAAIPMAAVASTSSVAPLLEQQPGQQGVQATPDFITLFVRTVRSIWTLIPNGDKQISLSEMFMSWFREQNLQAQLFEVQSQVQKLSLDVKKISSERKIFQPPLKFTRSRPEKDILFFFRNVNPTIEKAFYRVNLQQ